MEWVVPAILVVVLLAGVMIHRGIAVSRRVALAAWPPLALALRRRHELAGQLAQAARAWPVQEQRPVQAMLKARDAAIQAELSPAAAAEAERALGAAIGRVVAAAGVEPRIQRLVPALEGAEQEISAAAQAFNRAALAHNQACLRAPGIFVAKAMNVATIPYFALHAEDGAALQALQWRGIGPAARPAP